MKSIMRLSLLLILCTAMFTSCKKSAAKQTRHIPKNAVFVAAVNTKSITHKLAKSQATIENLFKSMAGSDTSLNKGKKEWEEFQSSGIDLDENFYVAAVNKGGGMATGKGTTVITGIGGLKDAAKLEAYIKKKQPKAEVRKEKDYTYASLEGNSLVGWSKDLVIVMSAERSPRGQMEFDSTTGEYNFKQPVNSEADTKTELASYFNLKEDESVASIPEFRNLVSSNADGSFWVNSQASVEDLPVPLPKLKELLQNNYTAATLNFEDGKIVVDSKSYCSQALQDIFKKYAGPTADLSLVEKYPSKNINGFMSFSFNPDMINGVINFLEMRAIADNYIKQAFGQTYSLDDLVKAMKGDIALVVSDFAMPAAGTAPGMPSMGRPQVKMIMNIPVGNAASMNKLMDKLVEMQLMVKNGNTYVASEGLGASGYRVVADDKNILMASDDETLNQYKAGSGKAVLPDGVMNDFKGKVAAFYVNIESILNGIPLRAEDKNMSEIMPKAKETFKDMRASADKFEGKYTAGHFELRLKNEKENSLVSLLQFFGTVGETFQKNKNVTMGMGEDVIIDSVPYPDTVAPR